MNGLEQVLPFLLIAVAFWFLLIRPQRKRQLQLLETQNSVAPGLEVMLGSGLFGRVQSTTDEHVFLEVAPGTVIKVARAAVVRVVEAEPVDEREATAEPRDLPGTPES